MVDVCEGAPVLVAVGGWVLTSFFFFLFLCVSQLTVAELEEGRIYQISLSGRPSYEIIKLDYNEIGSFGVGDAWSVFPCTYRNIEGIILF